MPHTSNSSTEAGEPMIYQIRVKGHLGSRWARWFEPMSINPQANGDTLLIGPLVDQAALHGALTKIRDLGLPLVSVMEVDPSQVNGPEANKE